MGEGCGFMRRYKPYRSQTMVRQAGHGFSLILGGFSGCRIQDYVNKQTRTLYIVHHKSFIASLEKMR